MVDKVLHAQMPFTTGKQTINDRLTAAYHSLAGSQLGKTVCKATTEEEMGPKKKHLDYLIHCTNEPNVSIPQLANLLIERTTSANWCTVFKALISLHNLMCYGNERFSQYLASANANFNMGNFLDKTCVQGYDMSTHVRRYAKYISEKIFTYRVMAFDFCKVKRGREDGLLRTMPTDRLLKSLPLLQGQIDSLLEFQVSSSDLTNGVINSCFILLFRDLIRLFACYNDGVINLLEKYFDMNKKQCREALELYKNFLTRMDKVAEFLKVAESVGIDKCEIPDLARAPSSLIEALEQHLASLEGQKAPSGGPGSRVASPTSGPSFAAQSAIKNLSSSGGFATHVVDPATLDAQARMKILQEEEQRLNMLKEQRMRELQFNQDQQIKRSPVQNTSTLGYPAAPKTNPFLQTPINEASAKSSSIDDLLSLDFSSPTIGGAVPHHQTSSSTNPFQSSGLFAADQFGQSASGSSPFRAAASTNGHSMANAGPGFASDDAFARAFTSSSDATKSRGLDNAPGVPGSMTQQKPPNKSASASKVLKGDLDSSLASLAENLNISKSQDALKSKPVQWNQQKPATTLQHQQYQAYGSNMTYGYQQPMVPSWGQPQPQQMPSGCGGMPGGAPNAQYYGQQMPMYPAQMGAMGGNVGYGGMSGAQQQPVRPPTTVGQMPADPFGTL